MKKHYKQILIIIVVIGILVCIKSCVDKKEADLAVAYIGYDFIDRQLFEENIKDFTEDIEDINGDGEFLVDIMEISFNESLNEADKSNSQSKLVQAIGAGNARIFFIDKEYVEKNKDEGVFKDISQFGEGIKNENGETVAISLENNEKISDIGIKSCENLYLAVRIVSEMDEVMDKSIEEKDRAATEIVENILIS